MRLNEDGSPSEFQLGVNVQCESLPDVACYIKRWDQQYDPTYIYVGDDDFDTDPDAEWELTGDGEWFENPQSDQVFVVMIGDDKEYLVDFESLQLIDDDEFCSQCGQIGCSHGR